jgi:hypothetical protein
MGTCMGLHRELRSIDFLLEEEFHVFVEGIPST